MHSLNLPEIERELPISWRRIFVRSETELLPWQNLLLLLSGLLPLEFGVSRESARDHVGEIIPGGMALATPLLRVPNVSSFRVPPAESTVSHHPMQEIGVRFADDPDVPFPFQGRSLRCKVAVRPGSIALQAGEKVLAESEVGPVWSFSREAGVKHFRSAFALPVIPPDGRLHEVLNGERFLEVLPLLHWLRTLTENENIGYEGPPLRACFIFDDPNLHWPRYGFVDYTAIAAHAAKENYHVSFATIPLDSWFTHQRTASIFKANAARLSLAIHGNNHTRQELAQKYSEAERSYLLRQAIARIERLERRAGFRVSRVMVPPHGACSEEMLADLPRHGFESACISHGSLHAHNRSLPWVRTLGFAPAEEIQGCPVLPRWGFSDNSPHAMLLAAFLRQPLILRGHHQDVKGGIELLDHHARFINGFGDVHWSNLTDLSRMNYQWRTEGSLCRIKLLGRRVVFQIPKGVTQLAIESSGMSASGTWQISGPGGLAIPAQLGGLVSLPETYEGNVLIEATTISSASVENIATWPTARHFARRLLTEGRDRLLS